MTSIVNGFTKQTSTRTAYDNGQPCSCFTCAFTTTYRECGKTDNKEDWEFGHEACCFTCPNKRQCAKPDKEECVIGADSHKRDPLTRVTWNGRGPNLQCIYDASKINTMGQIDNFKQKFGTAGDYNTIVANYCQQSSDTCVIDPDTGKNMTKCSRLKSTGKDGELCRGWFNQQPKHVQDTVVQNYCAINNTPDCKCINRSLNETYKTLKPGKVINDGCWFLPCANPQSYLQTTDVESPSCPDNFCDVIYNIIKDRDVSISDVQNDVNCVFKPEPKPTPPAPTPPGPTPPVPPAPTPPKPGPTPTPPKPGPTPTPPKPGPTPTPPKPGPVPGPIVPPVPPLSLRKNYLVLAFLVIVVMIPVFKDTRELFSNHFFIGSIFMILLGINVYSLQGVLNQKV
ncbi:putative myristylated membrane protein [Chloriridovirus anopheles1]|uniref:Putative myristylated membrane protein n=1 Tax=Chloriridovirus anopheles1 TaxID=1465751 RepID=W8QMZ3_9VIRU|nr:putative myristylated membrane protein [Anopheles minimus iridovirus]AHL67543.1 putative myristylated membrane protein [Anopheles minimus iridovirus]